MLRPALVLFLLTAGIWWGCFEDDCGDLKQTFYSVEKFEVIPAVDYTVSGGPYDLNLLDTFAISASELELVLYIEADYFTQVEFPSHSNPFSPGAWACTPAAPEAVESITNLLVTSNQDLLLEDGTELPAGSSLNDQFTFFGPFQDMGISITDFLASSNRAPADETYFIFHFLRLNANVQDNQYHRFAVEYTLDNAVTFNSQTGVLALMP